MRVDSEGVADLLPLKDYGLSACLASMEQTMAFKMALESGEMGGNCSNILRCLRWTLNARLC